MISLLCEIPYLKEKSYNLNRHSLLTKGYFRERTNRPEKGGSESGRKPGLDRKKTRHLHKNMQAPETLTPSDDGANIYTPLQASSASQTYYSLHFSWKPISIL